MTSSCATSCQANVPSAHLMISSIPRRLRYLLVFSIFAFFTYGAEAAPGNDVSQASLPQARARHAGNSVTGRASWYDPRMDGHKTATGERFSSHKMTAAATGIPLGSKVVVTNLRNGHSVQVRINDCGHFRHGRKLDLSKSAARKIGLIHDGTAPVRTAVISAPPGAKTCQ
jgi:rare lipoprotein A (peptidoglycan hydrolase)